MEKKLTAAEIVNYQKKDVPCIPIIGPKYFEPNGSDEEFSAVQNYLKAAGDLISFKKVQRLGSLSEAIWNPDIQKAEVIKQVGSCWSSMGHSADKKFYIYPEEALYLLEMGLLELKYNDVPMSIQRAYYVLLKPLTDVSEECYRVYSQLNANGYKVVRHKQSNVLSKYEKQLQIHKAGIKVKVDNSATKRENSFKESGGPSVGLKEQKLETVMSLDKDDKEDDLKKLQIFKSYDKKAESNLEVKYDVYLTSNGKNTFKKSCIQLPKVRIVVHRGCDPMPDLKEICHLVKQFEDEVPIIHAIVFPDSISFYNLSPINTPEGRKHPKDGRLYHERLVCVVDDKDNILSYCVTPLVIPWRMHSHPLRGL